MKEMIAMMQQHYTLGYLLFLSKEVPTDYVLLIFVCFAYK